MRNIVLSVAIAILLSGCNRSSPEGRYQGAIRDLAAAKTDRGRFYALGDAAKTSLATGHLEAARNYASELLVLAPTYKDDWNYGNAIQDGNLVLGRIAVREGRIEEAKKYLLEAGKGPGSPQMNSFGPNMSLANDLLAKGEKETVLEYFGLCRNFWKSNGGRLDQWARAVEAGSIPDFGYHLTCCPA